jgi:hypothetical protein
MPVTEPDNTVSPSTTGDAPPAPSTPSETGETFFPPDEPRIGASSIWLILGIVVVVVLVLAVAVSAIRHWVALHTGVIHGGPDQYYNFWSGFGSDLGEATLISAVGVGVYTGVRRVNCHTKGCWRIGKHHLEGTPYVLCRHHHPHVPSLGASHDHILEQHRRYKEAQAAQGH